MATTRAKFRCNTILDNGYSKEVALTAVFEGSQPEGQPESENRRFTKATPNGKIELTVNNPHAAVVFKPGKEYYVDFTEVAAPAEA